MKNILLLFALVLFGYTVSIGKTHQKSSNKLSDSTDISLEVDSLFLMAFHKQNNLDYQGASEVFTKIISIISVFPKPSYLTSVYIFRGYTKCILIDFLGALDDYNKYIELEPNDKLGYKSRGTLFLFLNDYKSAIEDFSIAIECNEEERFGGLFLERAKAKIGMGDVEGACLDWQRARELGGIWIGAGSDFDLLKEHCK